jgi:predicted MFS family arabinose efflux permease
MLGAMRRHPFLAWVALVGGVFEAGLSSITSAYGSQLGLSLGAATSIAGVLGVGSFILQYPIGWLADHVRTHRLLLAAGVILLIGSAPFALALQAPPVIWMAAFVWGAVGGALYTLTMIRVAHDFADSSAIAGTAAVIGGYTAGGALGSLVSGMVLDRFGALGQAGWLSLLAMSVLLGAWRSRRAAGQAV